MKYAYTLKPDEINHLHAIAAATLDCCGDGRQSIVDELGDMGLKVSANEIDAIWITVLEGYDSKPCHYIGI